MLDTLERAFGDERLARQIRFLVEMDRLKEVVRRTFVIGTDRYENSAEHSWQLALAAMILAEHANEPIDVPRTIKMLLVHDIIEIDAGDTYAYDPEGALDKVEREERAAERIFGLLPGDQAAEIRALWDEFEAGVTAEARFANAVDRVIPLLHNYYTEGRSWQAHGISRDQVMVRNRPVPDASLSLAAMVREIVDDAVARGYLAPSRGAEQ
ncbi:MAG: HD domain-containing protein [Anaerolineae bacterium]|nr:HD domain-containing protein [Anaerolineae bacterium]